MKDEYWHQPDSANLDASGWNEYYQLKLNDGDIYCFGCSWGRRLYPLRHEPPIVECSNIF